ncbi:MAG: hypothetical protein XD92_0829 [Proteiniphilum acetatigenes]|uniref:Uncharacterized protein n=1 Tax=Proteiniphilum acetatigenes TaxID=294710 RepID=A0A117M0C8_9BACT|nr:MAG: hypothetical protein XD92_0829 [Proteiniphilum acetatigenes]
MNKTVKILWWAIALLVVLNLTTIGTILFRNRESSDNNITIVLDENQQNPLTGRFFRQTLGFDDAQMNIFREAHRSFQYRANDLIFGMDSLKNEMFTELNSPTPDTIRLNELSEQVGSYHAELKKITNAFYLQLKTVCDSTQCEQLQQAFLPLFRDGTVNRGRGYQWNDSTGAGQGNRHRYGRRGSGE